MADDRCDLLCLDLPRAEQLRLARPAREITERAAGAAAALGDATRLEIAAALGRAGLVTSRRDGKMVMYQLTETGRRLLDAVISDLSEVPA